MWLLLEIGATALNLVFEITPVPTLMSNPYGPGGCKAGEVKDATVPLYITPVGEDASRQTSQTRRILLKEQIMIQKVSGGAWDSAFLTSFQDLTSYWSSEPHSELKGTWCALLWHGLCQSISSQLQSGV